MGLSIITPHYNDLVGLKRIYDCLLEQTHTDWQWVVVDDYSNKDILIKVRDWINLHHDQRIKFIFNSKKSNASVCRNLGIDKAHYEHCVFLDADDSIATDFVANRNIEVSEFAVYLNYEIVTHMNDSFPVRASNSHPLNEFLRANFIWQTTCVLWNKSFLIQIGKFDPNMPRLQDVELHIRALFFGKHYKFIDNKVDFFYRTKPIRSRPDIVRISCISVNYLIEKIIANYKLTSHQHSLIRSYYYSCVKNLHRSKNRNEVVYVKESLQLFYQERYVNLFQYFIGNSLLFFFKYRMISDGLFLKLNRSFFKY